MARQNIPLVTDEKYHVYNRGVDKRVVFIDHHDYIRFYLSLAYFNVVEPTQNYNLAKISHKTDSSKLVQIHAYALISNHFHFILEQVTDNGISEFMKRVSGGYTAYFNEKYDRSGALFQGRFKRVHIEHDSQYNYLFVYVNENHKVHNINIEREICHSSSVHYQNINKSKLLLDSKIIYDYSKAVELARDIHQKRAEFRDTLE